MTTLPVSVADVKAWLKVETTEDDALIEGLIGAAASAIETEASICLTEQPVRQQPVAGFPRSATAMIRLWKAPVTEVTAITYLPSDGGEALPMTGYRLVEGRAGGILPAAGEAWPDGLSGAGTVTIDYVAGYAADELPAVLVQAVKLLVGHWYGNRGEAGGGIPEWLLPMLRPFAPVGLA